MKGILLLASLAVISGPAVLADVQVVVPLPPAAGLQSTYSPSDVGEWSITIVEHGYAPGLSPNGIDLQVIANCWNGSTGKCPGFNVSLTQTYFATPVSAFGTAYSGTINGTGTTTQTAWLGGDNRAYREAAAIGDEASASGTSSVIPTAFSAYSTSGGFGLLTYYSLTLEESFSACTSGSCLFSVDGNITAVPEASSIVLLGAFLAVSLPMLRRRPK